MKVGIATMVNPTQQHKPINNNMKRGVGMSCSPPKAMVDTFLVLL
jgi:hypothetical protein